MERHSSECRFVQAFRFSTGREPPDLFRDTCSGGQEWSEFRGRLAPTHRERFLLCEKHREILRRETGDRGVPLPA
jgi:hypothetical protein